MGAGALNAKRALTQFSAGQFHPGQVPVIGWDFGNFNGGADKKYSLNQKLEMGSFVSITLAFDRKVTFDNDANSNGQFDFGDTFNTSNDLTTPGFDQFSNLDLMIYNSTTGNLIAQSVSTTSTIDHIFFQIPSDDNYEFRVHQDNTNGGAVDFSVAWWALGIGPKVTFGDVNGDGYVTVADISALMSALSNLSGYESTHGITD